MTKRKSTTKQATTLPYNKVCNLGDFADPSLVAVLGAMYPGLTDYAVVEKADGEFEVSDTTIVPVERCRRKLWETAVTVRALSDLGAVRDDARILSVGAGREWTPFYLTNHVEQVVMTDLYGGPGPWKNATQDMLINPDPKVGGTWNPQRLVTQHMDAREMRYPDNFFDGVFSTSAIEHFGSDLDIQAAAAEMARVLKPGGVLVIITEYKLDGPGTGWDGVRIMDQDDLDHLIVEPTGLALVDAVDLSVSEATAATQMTLMKHRVLAEEQSRPHIVFVNADHKFTSVALVFQK